MSRYSVAEVSTRF